MNITKWSGIKSWSNTIKDLPKLDVKSSILSIANSLYNNLDLEKFKKEAKDTIQKVIKLSRILFVSLCLGILFIILLFISLGLLDSTLYNMGSSININYAIMLGVFVGLSFINGVNIMVTQFVRMPSNSYWNFKKFLLNNRTNIDIQSDKLPLSIYILFNQNEDKKLIFASSLRIIKYEDEFLSRYMFKRRFSLRIYLEFANYTKNYCDYMLNKK